MSPAIGEPRHRATAIPKSRAGDPPLVAPTSPSSSRPRMPKDAALTNPWSALLRAAMFWTKGTSMPRTYPQVHRSHNSFSVSKRCTSSPIRRHLLHYRNRYSYRSRRRRTGARVRIPLRTQVFRKATDGAHEAQRSKPTRARPFSTMSSRLIPARWHTSSMRIASFDKASS